MPEPLATRYAASIAMTTTARAVTPGGAQTMSKQPARFPEGAFPAYLMYGKGARVQDVDGHWYVDWICGLGAVSLGHAHQEITEAVCRQASMLVLSSLGHALEEEVASLLLAMMPDRGRFAQVRFVKTGSEACAGAVRIARRAMKGHGEHVITIGYHGWHDGFQVVNETHPGVPDVYGKVMHGAPYNNLEQVENLLKREDVAAVIVEPVLLTPPDPAYLPTLARMTRAHGALLIFDEMVTGFRWARAGGMEYFGVQPDLAVFGKALGNGFPIAAIVGPDFIMRAGADVISGTFGGDAVSLAAAREVLRIYGAGPGPIDAQWEGGRRFLITCHEAGIPADGYPVHPRVTYTGRQMALFLQETARRGLLLHPAGFNVSAALTEGDMAVTEAALAGAAKAMEDPDLKLEGALPMTGAFARGTA